jgi:hypothetical protein
MDKFCIHCGHDLDRYGLECPYCHHNPYTGERIVSEAEQRERFMEERALDRSIAEGYRRYEEEMRRNPNGDFAKYARKLMAETGCKTCTEAFKEAQRRELLRESLLGSIWCWLNGW